jgi:hypothetical protein
MRTTVPGAVVSFLLVALILAASPSSAAAAPLEAPQVGVAGVRAREATLSGVLSPNTPGEAGATYRFLYDASATQCEGGLATSPGVSLGGQHEELPAEPIRGLSGGTEYTVCLAVTNMAGTETVLSAPAHFTTAIEPETPVLGALEVVNASTAEFHGTLNPAKAGNPGGFEFLYKLVGHGAGCEGESSTGGGASGAQGEAVAAEASGLIANEPYEVCLLARNEVGETAKSAVRFQFEVKPTLEGEATSNATEFSAEVSAKVNPNGLPLSECEFEYGTSTSYGESVPCAQSLAAIGSGRSAVPVSASLAGLSAKDSEYHWRLLAKSAGGSSYSADNTFSYPVAGSTGACPDEQARAQRSSTRLPDCRAYELVTPPEKNGAVIGNPAFGTGYPQIAEDGDRVIAKSIQCFGEAKSCVADRHEEGTPFEFERTPGGWVTRSLAPPASEFETYTSWSYNANTGMVLFSAPSASPTVPPTGEHGYQELFYAREPDGEFVEIGPLEEAGDPSGFLGEIGLISDSQVFATADLSHMLYFATHPYWGFDHTSGYSPETLYEYAGTGKSHPLLVGVRGGLESDELVSGCATRPGDGGGGQNLVGPLSESGRTVYFTAEGHDVGSNCPGTVIAPAANQLWARVDGEEGEGPQAAHSVLISGPASSGCSSAECVANATSDTDSEEGGAARDANFEGASDDGSTAVFASEQQLTDNAGQGEGDNLYESVCSEPCGSPGEEPGATERRLLDVTDPEGSVKIAGGPRELGVEAISADGSHVYFVAEGVLTGGQENQNHEKAQNGGDNLYVLERDEAHPNGHLVFIATLDPADEEHNWHRGLGHVANVTPDGQFLVFMSHKALTADDTRHEEGAPLQVYEYDAQTGVMVRVSVGEDGFNDDGNEGTGNASIVGAYIQGATAKSVPVRSDPTMSNDGAFVFFRSPVALTPGALNDVPVENGEAQNFYEYHDGQVYLVSDGRDTAGDGDVAESGPVGAESTSNLLGTDASGSNVFFSTFDQLVPEDIDTELDYYDARICSEGDPCQAPAVEPSRCRGEACQGEPVSAPVFGTPAGTATLSGSDNLAAAPAHAGGAPAKPAPAKKRTSRACKTARAKRKSRACTKAKKAKRARKPRGPAEMGRRGR